MIQNTIRFRLGDDMREVTVTDPTMTVLQWLRANGRTGTKEGCAEGDCGACTVAVGDPDADGRPIYRALNACILFLPQLDGRQLLTVEDLVAPDGTLHPVQQALVDLHASQCGFCTPGFVMSLFALFHRTDGTTDDETILDTLAGNLCRCTGYRPIVAAARAALSAPRRDRSAAAAAVPRSEHFAGSGTRFLAPRTTDAFAAALLDHPEACVLAGGTDVGLWVTKQNKRLLTVIALPRDGDLHAIEETSDGLRVGAGVTYARLLPLFAARWPSFGTLLRRLGSEQIRNSGTMGGNIANGSPIGDSMPALIALGASLTLRHGAARRTLALEDFYLGYRKTALRPGEFVESVSVPHDPAWRFATYKVSKRLDQDISAVAVGIALRLRDGRIEEARIAYGGMAATPRRAATVEAALHGQPWTLASVERAAARIGDDFRPLSDMRAGADYRLRVAANLLLRFVRESTGEPVRLGSDADA